LTKRPTWRNRIVGHADVPPSGIVANPANWREHPKAQAAALAGVLDEVGVVQSVIVNRQTGRLVDGHLRVSLAVQRKEPTIPVVYVDLTPAEEALVLATIDPLSAMATTDAGKLDELLREVSSGSDAVMQMLSDLAGPAIIGLDTELSEKRTNNNMQAIGKGERVGLQCGDLLVTIEQSLYDELWQYCERPGHESRAAAIEEILRAGLDQCSL
jgi:hypothetical protein